MEREGSWNGEASQTQGEWKSKACYEAEQDAQDLRQPSRLATSHSSSHICVSLA